MLEETVRRDLGRYRHDGCTVVVRVMYNESRSKPSMNNERVIISQNIIHVSRCSISGTGFTSSFCTLTMFLDTYKSVPSLKVN